MNHFVKSAYILDGIQVNIFLGSFGKWMIEKFMRNLFGVGRYYK